MMAKKNIFSICKGFVNRDVWRIFFSYSVFFLEFIFDFGRSEKKSLEINAPRKHEPEKISEEETKRHSPLWRWLRTWFIWAGSQCQQVIGDLCCDPQPPGHLGRISRPLGRLWGWSKYIPHPYTLAGDRGGDTMAFFGCHWMAFSLSFSHFVSFNLLCV